MVRTSFCGARKAFVVAILALMPSISFAQDFGGIAGALIGGAINAQRMQQYQYRQGNQPESRRAQRERKSSKDADEKLAATAKKAEDVRIQDETFAKIAPAAKELIEDASTFVKENPSNPKLLDFIQKISDLNAAVERKDAAKLKPMMEALAGDLRREPGYDKLEASRSKSKADEAARYLPELIKTAKQQQAFIRYFVTNNPTAAQTATFIPLLKDFSSNLAAPELEKLKSLTSKIDVSIRQAGLQTEFVRSRDVLVDQIAAKPNEPKLAEVSTDAGADQNVLRKTARTAFLSDGEPRDFLFLYNSSPAAPHVRKNLSGAVVFDNAEAAACVYEPNFDRSLIRYLKQGLAKYALQRAQVTSAECSRNNLQS